jgi:hypothetical protein
MKKILILMTIIYTTLANLCTRESCRTCCQVTYSGCINAIDMKVNVNNV